MNGITDSAVVADVLQAIISTSMDGFLLVSMDGTILEANETYCRMVGASREELLGLPVAELNAVDDRDEVAARLKQICQTGSLRFETRHRHRNGSAVAVEISAQCSPECNSFIYAFIRDITQQQRAAEILAARMRLIEFSFTHSLAELLRATLDEAEDLTESCIGFYHFFDDVSQNLTLQAWSTRTATLFCRAEGSGSHYPVSQAGVWVDCVHERRPVIHNDYASLPHRKGLPAGHAEVVRELVVPVFRGERIVAILGIGNKKSDYTQADIEVISTLACLAWEVTERKLAEEALRRSEETFRNIVDSSPLGMYFYRLEQDGSLIMTGANPSAERIVGVRHEELIGKRIEEAFPRLAGTDIPDLYRSVARGEMEQHSFEIDYDDGRVIGTYDVHVYQSGQNEITVNFLDISERKRSEEERARFAEQFQQTQRLESLGVLAGGIAHDFNNILQAIMGNATMASMRLAPDSPAVTCLLNIEQASARAADLCRQMLAYAGKGQCPRSSIRLGKLVDEMVRMLRASISQNVTIHLEAPQVLPTVKGDDSQIRQIVMNLIINAAEAIGEEPGTILVTLRRVDVAAAGSDKDHLGRPIAPGSYVRLEVADSGCGMTEEVQSHIFEPFYTTKFTGRGLGMSAVLGIISSHGGALRLASEAGLGTTFWVYLPAEKGDAAAHEETGSPETECWSGSGTVLLVEDEPQILELAREMLQLLGFKVIEASDGQAGLDRFREHRDEITLVLTDIGLPVMDGYRLVTELKQLAPQVPIIVSSGFGDTVVGERFAPGMVAGLISKPYHFQRMLEVVRSVVGTGDKR